MSTLRKPLLLPQPAERLTRRRYAKKTAVQMNSKKIQGGVTVQKNDTRAAAVSQLNVTRVFSVLPTPTPHIKS